MKNNMKKKILVVALVAIVLVMSIAGTTIAYFTDDGKSENEFTVGKVDIDLTAEFNTAGNIYPTKTVSEGAATIKVAHDSEPAYIGAILTIYSDNGDVTSIIGEGKIPETNKDKATIAQIISGINTSVWDVYTSYDTTNKVVTVYFVAKSEAIANATLNVFESVSIPAAWGNTEMDQLRNKLHINLYAYAVQSAGLEGDALAALHQAGFDVFDGVVLP